MLTFPFCLRVYAVVIAFSTMGCSISWYLLLAQPVIHLHLVLQLVLQAVFLYFQIAYHSYSLPVQRHKGVLVLDAVAHQAAQGNDDVADHTHLPVNESIQFTESRVLYRNGG